MSTETPFEWLPEYDSVLEQIASTDVTDTDWSKLRDILKYKLDQNVTLFLSQSNDPLPPRVVASAPRALAGGGLKLPPFPARQRDERNPNEAPRSIFTADEAKEYKDVICRQIDEFEGPPFTMQRLAELCLHPQKHYKLIGKYLRAVEKTLLVTSTWDAFPASPEGTARMNSSVTFDGVLLSSAPPTPMFSPIPFLHDDARRSKSRSPPPSPLVLPALAAGATATMPGAAAGSADVPVLGLVDELDDPSPGHLSDHPQPLSSTTTVEPKPIAPLAERFVKSSEDTHEGSSAEEGSASTQEEMVVDDPEKENKAG